MEVLDFDQKRKEYFDKTKVKEKEDSTHST